MKFLKSDWRSATHVRAEKVVTVRIEAAQRLLFKLVQRDAGVWKVLLSTGNRGDVLPVSFGTV